MISRNEIGNRFVSLTYDAFSKSILDHFRFALPEDVRPKGSYSVNENEIIDAAFRKAGYINTQHLSPGRLRDYYDKILEKHMIYSMHKVTISNIVF